MAYQGGGFTSGPPGGTPGYPGYGYPGGYPYPMRPTIRFEVIGEAWRLLVQSMETWLPACLIAGVFFLLVGGVYVAVELGPMIRALMAGGRPPANFRPDLGLSALNALVNAVLQAFFVAGCYRIATRQVRGEPFGVGDLFKGMHAFPGLLVLYVLYAIVQIPLQYVPLGSMAGGMAILFVQGLLMFVPALMVDQRLGLGEAIRRNWQALQSQAVLGACFFVIVSLIAFAGALVCCVGALVTYPLLFLSVSLLYRDFFLTDWTAYAARSYEPPAVPYTPAAGYGPPAGPPAQQYARPAPADLTSPMPDAAPTPDTEPATPTEAPAPPAPTSPTPDETVPAPAEPPAEPAGPDVPPAPPDVPPVAG